MKILVIGASGRIGEKLVYNLRQESCSVVEASPSFGVDTVTGVGLAKAVSDAEIVIDVSDSPSSDGEEALAFFERSGLNLLAAGRAAGVRHHIALSIVGLERLLTGDYFRAKKLQEDLITGSGLPYIVLRSTQFFELISDLAQRPLGSDVAIPPVLVQPISSDDLADALTEIALGRSLNRTLEVAGPERRRLDELAALVLVAYEGPRRVVADSRARYFGVVLDDGSLLPGERAHIVPSRFDDWLRQTLQPRTYVPLEWRRRSQQRMATHTKG
jgi:uncharacterized protein YbjT (DUF2867 family)